MPLHVTIKHMTKAMDILKLTKDELQALQTDTEIIPHLIEHFIKEDNTFKDSVMKTIQKIEGSFAIVALDKLSGSLAGARDRKSVV